MKLVRLNPFGEIRRDSIFQNDVNSLLNSFISDSLGGHDNSNYFTPNTDVKENETDFLISLALPGMKKEEVKIEIDKGILSVSGERKIKEEKKGEKIYSIENYYGKFSRSFRLPENVDLEKITASLTDGELELIIPKKDQRETKTLIKVN